MTIGHGVTILPGVRVGTGAVIGAGAAVSKDVAPYEIVLSEVFRRHIKWRFTPAQATALQGIAWWYWDHAALKAALPDIRALDIDAFNGLLDVCASTPPC